MAKTSPARPAADGRTGWVPPRAEQRLSSLRFARSDQDVLVAGVAGGLGARWGVEPMVVRIGFVVLSLAGAIGVVAYLVAWFLSVDPLDPHAPETRDTSNRQTLAFGCLILGSVLLFRAVGLWLGDALGMPVLIVAAGAAVVYAGAGPELRARWTFGRGAPSIGRPSFAHLLLGGMLVVGGVVWFLTTNRTFDGVVTVLLAVGVTTLGLAIVFGPWVYRLVNQLTEERRDRIRSEERAELAAHLHDSVLQTLALIQRNASNPRRMANLARRQERELRAWLWGRSTPATGALGTAIREMADAIEEAHEISVETVMVGDTELDDRTRAVVAACREAATNAAIHSGTEEVSVYVESEPGAITAYVRDRGRGFDPDDVPEGRKGLAESIRGRIERWGGNVSITSAPGEGCEVQINMRLQ